MLTLTDTLLIINALLLTALLGWQWLLHREAAAMDKKLSDLAPPPLAPPALAEVLGTGAREIIAIEVLNPLELAAKEHWLAGKFASLAPELLRKIVYAKTLQMMGPILETYGVKADVRLHRAP